MIFTNTNPNDNHFFIMNTIMCWSLDWIKWLWSLVGYCKSWTWKSDIYWTYCPGWPQDALDNVQHCPMPTLIKVLRFDKIYFLDMHYDKFHLRQLHNEMVELMVKMVKTFVEVEIWCDMCDMSHTTQENFYAVRTFWWMFSCIDLYKFMVIQKQWYFFASRKTWVLERFFNSIHCIKEM